MGQTRQKLTLENKEEGMILTSNVTGASYNVGTWSTPSLGELRERALYELQKDPDCLKGTLSLEGSYGDV
jgi:hypothetical protein